MRHDHVDNDNIMCLAGMLHIGSLLGCVLAGISIERLGRRFTMRMLASLCFLFGYLIIMLANSAALIYLGRFINGMGVGAVMTTATIYIVEIASTDMRGVLGCFIQFMGGFGILLTFVLGYWLSWWQLAAASCLLVLPFTLGMFLVPESPHWYLSQGVDTNSRMNDICFVIKQNS